MSVERLAAQVACALRVGDEARCLLVRATELIRDAQRGFAAAFAGTADPDAAAVEGSLAEASQVITHQIATISEAEQIFRDYLRALGVANPVPHDRPPPVDRLERIRASLPPAVTPGSGQKTHGRWTDANGQTHEVVSGKDDKDDEVVRLLKSMRARRMPLVTTHVEIKLAAHMRKNQIRSITLTLNNIPCMGDMGCEALISVILPAGYTMTVHGSDGVVREYRGGGTSEWVP
ncbi:DddA-like double-stranded DNA deaminase toxin [Actinokineospora sp.]|uniref:DddA-like double-stranded DNA deaminase toxin n=1 Tax=Actinokineospora sp. TaxID=1872133 RepID=UPI003D6C26CC